MIAGSSTVAISLSSYVQIRAPSQYVCSLDNRRTDEPRARVSRTWRLATSISVTSFEPTLKT